MLHVPIADWLQKVVHHLAMGAIEEVGIFTEDGRINSGLIALVEAFGKASRLLYGRGLAGGELLKVLEFGAAPDWVRFTNLCPLDPEGENFLKEQYRRAYHLFSIVTPSLISMRSPWWLHPLWTLRLLRNKRKLLSDLSQNENQRQQENLLSLMGTTEDVNTAFSELIPPIWPVPPSDDSSLKEGPVNKGGRNNPPSGPKPSVKPGPQELGNA